MRVTTPPKTLGHENTQTRIRRFLIRNTGYLQLKLSKNHWKKLRSQDKQCSERDVLAEPESRPENEKARHGPHPYAMHAPPKVSSKAWYGVHTRSPAGLRGEHPPFTLLRMDKRTPVVHYGSPPCGRPLSFAPGSEPQRPGGGPLPTAPIEPAKVTEVIKGGK